MLTAKQKRFCEEYLVDMNATQAAVRAGYSSDTAYSIGWENLRKPEIRKHIDATLEEMSLGPKEVKKLISDIAQGSLNDYFTIKKVEHTPRVVKSLKILIRELQFEIEFERQFSEVANLSTEEVVSHLEAQKQREYQIIRYQLELKFNPRASRIVNGKTVMIDSPELDMGKLIADKKRGRIKSLSYSTDGRPKVEMYAADGALRDVAKIHGLYKEPEETKPPLTININGKGVKIT